MPLGNFIPIPSSASFVKFSQPQPYLDVQKARYTREPSGSKQLLTTKSSRSSIALPSPKGWNDDHKLYPSTQGIETIIIIKRFIITAFFFFFFQRSIAKEIILSKTAITV